MINFETLKDTFGCNFNILIYCTVKAKVMSFIKKYQVENTFYFERPATPYHLQIFLHAHQGCKSYYKILKIGTYDKPQCERIWDPILKNNFENLDIEAMWPVIYKNCFKCIEENQVMWFQYRVLFKILGTKDYLKKVKKKVKLVTDSVCGLCSQNNETIEHLFCRCTKFLPTYNGVIIMIIEVWTMSLIWMLASQDWGDRFGNLVYFLPVEKGYKECTIVHLEMVNILLALRLFCILWLGRKMLVRCDNKAVVSVLSTGRSRDPFLSACARNIWYCSAKHDIDTE